jgi:hypothetical protein
MLLSIINNIKKFAKTIIKNLKVLNIIFIVVMNSRNRDRNPEFENHLLSIKTERENMIHPKSHPTYNERHQKIIEMIDWTMNKYKIAVDTQKMNQQAIIDNIIEELDRKREVAINKKQKTLLKDEVLEYGEEEDTIDYVLFRIRESTGKMY